jgi:hypothetical protein
MGQLISTHVLQPSAAGGVAPGAEIRDQLRMDHDSALAGLEALRAESDAERCFAMLRRLRRVWVIHALAEETVVYRALESAEDAIASGMRADDRFVEHERVEGAFEMLARSRPGTPEWRSRVDSVRELILHHIRTEHDGMFAQLARHFDAAARAEMGERFELARDKLTVLEEAKAHRARGGEGRPGASSGLQ